jgi:hypothetical protein
VPRDSLAERAGAHGELSLVFDFGDLEQLVARLDDRGSGAEVRTAMVSLSRLIWKLWSPAVTVTTLRAWIMPTWMRWVATMMEPRCDTRRCAMTGLSTAQHAWATHSSAGIPAAPYLHRT